MSDLDFLFNEPDEHAIDDAISNKRWPEARNLIEKALALMPPDWHPLTETDDWVSGAFWDSAEFSAYSKRFGPPQDKSIMWISPSYSRLWWRLAVTNSSEGLETNALTCLDRALELEPDHPLLWIDRGYILNRMERHSEALAAYQTAAVIRTWAPDTVVARALRGQGHALIELGQLTEAHVVYLRSLELVPGNETAEKELEYIDHALRDKEERSKTLPWFLHCICFPPTDPLTVQLVALVDGLDSIPGPKTVGPENYSTISKAFFESGWEGFEKAFDSIISRDRADYVEIKRNILREPIFMTAVHKRMARLYLGKATIDEVFCEIEQSKTQVKLQ